MDSDQVLKQLEWLDGERRKDKDIISRQEDRIASLEGNIAAAHQQIKDLSGEMVRLAALSGRIDGFDEAMVQQRIEINRQFEEAEKQYRKREEELQKVRRVEMRAVDGSLAEMHKEVEAISGLRRSLQERVEEEMRLARSLDELRIKVQDMHRNEEEFSRLYRLIEDGRRQDSKRLVDLQGEVTALRKRADELRAQGELLSVNFRKAETRLNELTAIDAERRDALTGFLEKQTLGQVEYERTWKEWQTRIGAMDKHASEIEAQLVSMDETHRSVKRLKESTDELVQRIERRINEITEVQRLAEERFRQEWVTFKADDQKRWTNYTLTMEEQRGEILRNFEKMAEQVTHLDDTLQELQDLFHQMSGHTEKRLQSLMSMVHDWLIDIERMEGRSH